MGLVAQSPAGGAVHTAPSDFPRCFSALRFYRSWCETRCARVDMAMSICDDCTSAYQAAMKRAGRCEHPEKIVGLAP